ncbi:MAG: hypothetical protein AAF541_03455 [Pseudomonadota bacterium]
MRLTPLLIILLTLALHSDVALANESVQISGAAAETISQHQNFGRTGLEKSSTSSASFEYSTYLVVAIGIAGLIWMRRQGQSL